MAKVLYEEQAVADIAAAIREINNTDNKYNISEMADAIRNLIIKEKPKQSNQLDVVITGITCVSNATTDYITIT